MNPRPITPRRALRQLIAGSGYTMVPGAYDTLTARLVEQAGFAAVYLTGGGYSRASGYPDLGLLTMVENVRFIGLTVEAVGDPGHRRRRYRLRQRDQRDPHRARIREIGGRRVPYRGPGRARRNAAITRARRSSPAPRWSARSRPRSIRRQRRRPGHHRPLGRARGRGAGGRDRPGQRLSRSRRRCRLCRGAAECRGIADRRPAGARPGAGQRVRGRQDADARRPSELEGMGFRLGIYPSQTHRAAIRAAQRVLRAMKEDGDTRRVEADLATFQEREEAVGTERWRALEEKYLRDV